MLFTENMKRMLAWHGWTPQQFSERSHVPLPRLEALLNGEEAVGSELVTLCRSLGTNIDRMLTRVVQPVDKRQVKMLVLDVDGVMTDGGMYVMEDGNEMKRFHTRDGRGIKELQKRGTAVAFLSGSFNGDAIRKRAERLGIDRVFAGRQPKTGVLENWMAELSISYAEVAYIGDDLNDLEVIGMAGLTACPADAIDEVKEKVDIVLQTRGGGGCVREFVDTYLM